MEDYIQFSAKTKNEAITKACLELGTSSDQLDIQVISEGSSGFFGIGSKPAVIKVRRIEPVSDMQEIDELVESVKLDAIKEEKKLEKPFTPDVKKESAPKAAPAEEKKPVKKEAVQVEKASEEAPAKAAAPKERPARDFQGKAKPAREKQPRAPKERQPKETRERAPKQGRHIYGFSFQSVACFLLSRKRALLLIYTNTEKKERGILCLFPVFTLFIPQTFP